MKNIMSEMKNTLERIQNRLDEAEYWNSDLKDKVAANTHRSKKKKKD